MAARMPPWLAESPRQAGCSGLLRLAVLWFFLTPICYPVESLPAAAMPVLSKNPLFVLVAGYRAIFLERHPPAFHSMWKLWLGLRPPEKVL